MDAVVDARPPEPAGDVQGTTYRFGLGWRILMTLVLGPLFCLALGVLYVGLTGDKGQLSAATVGTGLIFGGFAAATAWLLIEVLSWRVTLAWDSIETSSLWRGRRLRRDQIAGIRYQKSDRTGRILVVIPTAADLKPIALRLRFIGKHEAFHAWFAALRDLDALDMNNSIASIAANAAFGTTPEQRLYRMERARKLARGLNLAAFGVAAWCLFAPQPYGLAIACAAALPAVAVILVGASRGLFRFGSGKNEAYANVGAAIAPAFVVFLRALFDLNLLTSWPLIAAAAIGAIGIAAILGATDRSLRARQWMLLVCGLAASAYAFGVLGEADILLDHSPPSVFRSMVLAKSIDHIRWLTIYHLRLAPWGPQRTTGNANVPQAVFEKLPAGRPACVLLRDGAFGISWFSVAPCSDREAR